jgi:hypothetical protein
MELWWRTHPYADHHVGIAANGKFDFKSGDQGMSSNVMFRHGFSNEATRMFA